MISSLKLPMVINISDLMCYITSDPSLFTNNLVKLLFANIRMQLVSPVFLNPGSAEPLGSVGILLGFREFCHLKGFHKYSISNSTYLLAL
jgi:hypothetical protein